MDIGLRIKELRIKRNLSQKALSEAVGIDTSHFSKIERGKAHLTIIQLMDLSSILEASTDWILKGVELVQKENKLTDNYKDKYIDLLEENIQLHKENKELRDQLGANENIVFQNPKSYTATEDDNKGLVGSKEKLK